MSSHPAEELSTSSSIAPSVLSSSDPSPVHLPSNSARRGTSGGRGQWRGRGRGRGGRYISSEAGEGLENPQTSTKAEPPPRPRPTHFLSLPLHDHQDLRNRVSAFQSALLGDTVEPATSIEPNPHLTPPTNKRKGKPPPPRISTVVEGLDTSIVIDPWRLHMTLGVMALEPDETPIAASECPVIVPDSSSTNFLDPAKSDRDMAVTDPLPCNPPKVDISQETVTEPLDQTTVEESTSPGTDTPTLPRKTITSALALLKSLKPTISDILSGSNGVEIPLEILHVFNTERMRGPNTKPGTVSRPHIDDPNSAVEKPSTCKEESTDVGAGVLFLGPRQGQPPNDDRRKLERVCDLIYHSFKKEGYLTDTRPLKLHFTILNASHRKPKRRIPFSYSDILALPACQLLGADPVVPQSELSEIPAETPTDAGRVVDSSAPKVKVAAITGGVPVMEEKPKYRPPLKVPPPLPVALGTYCVREVQLWEMGSHGPNNEYVSHGGIVLE